MKINFKNKKISSTIISLIVVGILAVGVTVAYINDQTEFLTNMFSIADLDISTKIEEDVKGDLTKVPTVINTGSADALVRIRLSISNKEDFEKNFGLSGIDTKKQNVGINGGWIADNPEDRYNTYYYYSMVLKGNSDPEVNERTNPLFDMVLNYEDSTYTPFDFVEEPKDVFTPKNEEDVKKLKLLNDIGITIYQESVPTQIKTKDGTVLNAIKKDDKGNDVVDIDIAKKIFQFFESNPN